MKKPNFFIIGAPKCGTTSLARWLAQHPEVYMSPVKEPHYFDFDFPRRDWKAPQDYYALFEEANEAHRAIGEASVYYLWSKVAVGKIEEDLPGSKFIIMLRNPVEMAPSFHSQNLFIGDEDVEDFETAWNLQKKREQGWKLPKKCRDPKLVQYRRGCMLGEQLEKTYANVERNRVCLVFLEDLKSNHLKEWSRILEFLGVSYWDNLEFLPENRSKYWRWPWVRDLQRRYSHTRRRFNLPPLGWGVFNGLRRIAIKQTSRQSLSPELRKELVRNFSDDIDLLSQLTGRDLSHWKKV